MNKLHGQAKKNCVEKKTQKKGLKPFEGAAISAKDGEGRSRIVKGIMAIQN